MSDKKLIEDLQSQIVDLKIRVKRLEEYLLQFPDPTEYIDENADYSDSENVREAIKLVCQFNTASASFLQRKMSIGYSRASRLLDHLEELGVVGPAEGGKPREVIVKNAEEFLKESQKKS